MPLIFIGVIFSCKTENKSKKSTPLDSFSKDYLISFKISPDIYIKQLSDSLNRVLPDTFSYYFDEIEDSMSFKQTYIDELIDSLTYQNYNICVSKQILNDTLFIKNVFYYSGYYRFTGNIEFKRDSLFCCIIKDKKQNSVTEEGVLTAEFMIKPFPNLDLSKVSIKLIP